MKYPLFIAGVRAGEASAEADGLYVAITAVCAGRRELTRLWLHGGGEEKYLGVMRPEGEGMRLERRVSRRALGVLAEKAEYVSDRSSEEEAAERTKDACAAEGHGRAEQEAAENEGGIQDGAPVADELAQGCGEKAGETEEREEGGEQTEDTSGRAGGDAAEDASADRDAGGSAGEEDGLIWFRTESGALTAFDGTRTLTALPAKLRHGREGIELKTIEGQEYMVFRY